MNFFVWKEIFYFSALNDRSLALADSIKEFYKKNTIVFRRPVLVFTDVYADEDEEKETERVLKAKSLGAICLKEDIVHVSSRFFSCKTDKANETEVFYGGIRFFLFDDENNEIKNLSTISKIAASNNYKIFKNLIVYLFSQNDIYEQIELRVKKSIPDPKYTPRIRPVRGYQTLIYNSILLNMPLYSPLVGRSKSELNEQGLNITIFGTGKIGIEMFLASYWCGQLLDCPLTIGIKSYEEKDSFVGRIDGICPEIMKTAEVDSDVLK